MGPLGGLFRGLKYVFAGRAFVAASMALEQAEKHLAENDNKWDDALVPLLDGAGEVFAVAGRLLGAEAPALPGTDELGRGLADAVKRNIGSDDKQGSLPIDHAAEGQ